MSTRHERRKAAKARWTAKAEKLVAAHHAWERAKVVNANLSNPKRPSMSPKGMGNRGIYSGAFGDYARGGHRPTFSTPNGEVKGKR